MKKCTKCNIEKELTEFNKSNNNKDKLSYWCKICSVNASLNYVKNNEKRVKQRKKDWYDNNAKRIKEKREELSLNPIFKEKIRLRIRATNLKINYNMTLEEYDLLLKNQNECCKICKKHQSLFKKAFSVDHCHKTGKIRGLLCKGCNIGIGELKEDIQILKNAIEYLK